MSLIGLKYMRDAGETILGISIYPKGMGILKLLPQLEKSNGELFNINELLDQIVEKHVATITEEGLYWSQGFSVDDLLEDADEFFRTPEFWRPIK